MGEIAMEDVPEKLKSLTEQVARQRGVTNPSVVVDQRTEDKQTWVVQIWPKQGRLVEITITVPPNLTETELRDRIKESFARWERTHGSPTDSSTD